MMRFQKTRGGLLAALGLGAFTMMTAGTLGIPSGFAEETRPDKPNIIFIMADDLGYADLGCYGQKLIRTPNIDRMAEEGIRFTQCYTGSTVCAPSRSVLITGQHTGHTRVRGNFGKVGGTPPQGRVPLEPEDITVAEVLKEAGYATGITGKWGLGEPDTTGIPNRQGFDEWFGYLNQRNAHTYYPPYLWKNEEKVMLEGNRDGKKEQYTHDMMTDFALDFIYQHRKEPFFLYVAWCIPHAKYEVPSLEPYEDEDWPDPAKPCAAMVTRMDRDVGRILAMLRACNIDENTIVFFCSDNGAAERFEGLFDSSGALRGRKRDMYEGGIRTPMVVRWPGKIAPGTMSDLVWYFADVLPTAADLAGAESPETTDGVSVLPALLGEDQDLSDRFLYWEFFERGYQQAVRWKDWKAIRPQLGEPLELYNLAEDLGEQNNIAADYPEVVETIEDYLKTARSESPNWPLK
jgi:arylsulfatase A-like enzyme